MLWESRTSNIEENIESSGDYKLFQQGKVGIWRKWRKWLCRDIGEKNSLSFSII